jgi:L,D-transpeptidase catalytic domain/Putative peptidoglycan binding domain
MSTKARAIAALAVGCGLPLLAGGTPADAKPDDRPRGAEAGDGPRAVKTDGTSRVVKTDSTSRVVKTDGTSRVVKTGDRSRVVKTGDGPRGAEAGDRSRVVKTGDRSRVVKTGDGPRVVKTGDRPRGVRAGDRPADAETGDRPADVETGDRPADAEVEPVVLRPGHRGESVRSLQKRLHGRGHYFGKINGVYDDQTRFAVWALQKSRGMTPRGEVGRAVWKALDRPARVRPLVPGGAADRVEIDLTRQLLTVYRHRRPVLTSHISSGAQVGYCHNGHCGDAVTPVGDFRVTSRAPGWTTGRLGSMFNSLYFVGGVAIHGSAHVPLRPASHGCVRVPMTVSKRLYEIVGIGDPVYVRGAYKPRSARDKR